MTNYMGRRVWRRGKDGAQIVGVVTRQREARGSEITEPVEKSSRWQRFVRAMCYPRRHQEQELPRIPIYIMIDWTNGNRSEHCVDDFNDVSGPGFLPYSTVRGAT